MAVDHIRYDILAQEALRGVVRTVLDDAAKNGLPGEHHFFITFDTRAEGVRIPQRLLAQFPQEMTIVLQHQFWDLTVTDTGFEVGMSFGGIPERLIVPFQTITVFADPSVQFRLQFETAADATAAQETQQETQPARPPAEHKQRRTTPAIVAAAPPANGGSPSDAGNEPDKPSGGGEVVRLDRFRKK